MPRSRDYKAEYQRRLANAQKRGLSRSQARGHARAGETAVGKPAGKADPRLEEALKLYRKTGNRTKAAKTVGIAPERFSRFLAGAVQISGRGKSLKIADTRPREMLVLTNGEALHLHLAGHDQASLNGEYLNAVKAFISSNDRALLRPFEGRSVIDAKGKAHPLETDPNALHRLAAAGSEVFHDIYRLII